MPACTKAHPETNTHTHTQIRTCALWRSAVLCHRQTRSTPFINLGFNMQLPLMALVTDDARAACLHDDLPCVHPLLLGVSCGLLSCLPLVVHSLSVLSALSQAYNPESNPSYTAHRIGNGHVSELTGIRPREILVNRMQPPTSLAERCDQQNVRGQAAPGSSWCETRRMALRRLHRDIGAYPKRCVADIPGCFRPGRMLLAHVFGFGLCLGFHWF